VRGPVGLESHYDSLEEARHIADHVIVPKTEYTVIVSLQPVITKPIPVAVRMLAAVNFHN
jgi:hypothetical protein